MATLQTDTPRTASFPAASREPPFLADEEVGWCWGARLRENRVLPEDPSGSPQTGTSWRWPWPPGTGVTPPSQLRGLGCRGSCELSHRWVSAPWGPATRETGLLLLKSPRERLAAPRGPGARAEQGDGPGPQEPTAPSVHLQLTPGPQSSNRAQMLLRFKCSCPLSSCV